MRTHWAFKSGSYLPGSPVVEQERDFFLNKLYALQCIVLYLIRTLDDEAFLKDALWEITSVCGSTLGKH